MKEEPTVEKVQDRDTRPEAISSVWWATLAMLGVCIPLVAVLKSASFPFLVIGGAVVATSIIWRTGQEKAATSEREVEEMRNRIRDLEERLANVEVINSFEERLAESEARKASPPAREERENAVDSLALR